MKLYTNLGMEESTGLVSTPYSALGISGLCMAKMKKPGGRERRQGELEAFEDHEALIRH